MLCLLLLLLLSPWAQATPLLDEMLKARDFVCELKATPAQPGARSLMIFIENLEPDKAQIVSSGSNGVRPVQVYSGETGVHLVEEVAASVRVTSLVSCLRWRDREDGRDANDTRPARCVRYEVVNRWHFDTSIRRNPDQAFLRQAENSWAGWCEPWRME